MAKPYCGSLCYAYGHTEMKNMEEIYEKYGEIYVKRIWENEKR